MDKDYYQILGVKWSATQAEIRAAYRQQAMQYHPDRNPGDPKAEDIMQLINEAYGVLSDPERRRQYDQARAAYSIPIYRAEVVRQPPRPKQETMMEQGFRFVAEGVRDGSALCATIGVVEILADFWLRSRGA